MEMAPRDIRTTELTLNRTMAAKPADIFDRWLDAKKPGSPWFGIKKAIVNPVVDGLFYHAVHFEEHDWAHYGRFLALERGRRIEHTWVSEATRGLESVVTLTFEAQGANTLVTLHHLGIPDDEMGRRHRDGWGYCLDALAQALTGAKA
jgi:uncharacterized protein YndB with AHSA1/START domain